MTIKHLIIKDNIQSKNLNIKTMKDFSKRFDKIYLEIQKDVKNETKTLNVLDKKFKFNFKIKDLDKFKRFKTLVIIGMGGSILGTEAIYNFFKASVKKKFIF